MDAPTDAARRFNRLDQEYSVSLDSRVQTFDVSSMQDPDLWSWWQSNAGSVHSMIADSHRKLLKQLHATGESNSEILVADCQGQVKYHHEGDFGDEDYSQLKAAIDDLLLNEICPL